jgi:hypothetical protein
MLWTYGLGFCVHRQIAPYTIYDVTIYKCTLPLKVLLMVYFEKN